MGVGGACLKHGPSRASKTKPTSKCWTQYHISDLGAPCANPPFQFTQGGEQCHPQRAPKAATGRGRVLAGGGNYEMQPRIGKGGQLNSPVLDLVKCRSIHHELFIMHSKANECVFAGAEYNRTSKSS